MKIMVIKKFLWAFMEFRVKKKFESFKYEKNKVIKCAVNYDI